MKKKNEKQDFNGETPFFDAPDDKILAFDMFRGPTTGVSSEFDLDNPSRKFEQDINNQD
ncbi:hypothetical protein LCL95_15835 [Bacillus timonensis]|nr:hypothetical protein [Bacillus timonensis]